jgi:hypothetical protein
MFTALNVLHLFADEQKYIYIFDDANRAATLRQIARDAANPELSLSWCDAAVLSKKVRETPTCEETNDDHHHISPYCLKSHNRRCAD